MTETRDTKTRAPRRIRGVVGKGMNRLLLAEGQASQAVITALVDGSSNLKVYRAVVRGIVDARPWGKNIHPDSDSYASRELQRLQFSKFGRLILRPKVGMLA